MVARRLYARILPGLVVLGMVAGGCSLTPTALPPTPPQVAASTLPPTTDLPTMQAEDAGVAPDLTIPALPKEGENMTLTVLFDNDAHDPRLQTGWGFSAWLDYGGQGVLFDTGASGAALLDNMATLGLDPKAIDIVILSHDHSDHTGGLARLLAVNSQLTVYLPEAFSASFKREVRATGAAVVEVDAPMEIMPGLWSTGRLGSTIVEQAVVAKAAEGLVVLTGCAHPGVDKMAARARKIGQGEIALVVGGFHLGGASRGRIQEIIAEFRRLGVRQVAPCHCTGDQAKAQLREAYGDRYLVVGAGWQWTSQAVTWQSSGKGIPAQLAHLAVVGTRQPGDELVRLGAPGSGP